MRVESIRTIDHKRNSLLTLMLGIIATIAILLQAALLFLASTKPSFALQISTPARIVAIGDLHGDYAAFQKVFTRAGLMDGKGNWSGGNTIVVQTGDIPDRGPDTRKILADLRKLQEQADEFGGKVITLIGNHEAMNVIGDLRYVHPGEFAAFVDDQSLERRQKVFQENLNYILTRYREEDPDFSIAEAEKKWEEDTPPGFIEHRQAWSPDGEIGSWIISNDVMTIVGDSLFAHGGPSAKYTQYTIEEINGKAQEALRAQNDARDTIIRDSLGPLWYRELTRDSHARYTSGNDNKKLTIEKELALILDHFDVKRIVIGHTRSEEGIKASHNARVIQIDTGMSAYYSGTNSFLEIRGDEVFANDDGRITKISD